MHNDVAAKKALTKTAQSVLQTLMVSGPMSRAELSRRLSLSAASLTKITSPLLRDEFFVELELDETNSIGRPPQPIDINVDFVHFIGVKLTGESIFCVRTDARGQILSESETPLTDTTPGAVVEQIAEKIEILRQIDPSIAAVGVALSGNAVRNSPVVGKSPFLHWMDVPLGDLISERVGLPVTLENDVRAVTAAEQWFGMTSADSFVMLTFGVGIGCGIVVNGQQVEGHAGGSGLIGHTRIDGSGPLCYAGHPGCAHAYATTGAISSRISIAVGRPVTFEECLELHSAGNAAAIAAFDAAGRAIGALIALVVNLIGPDVIVISGEGVELYTRGQAAAGDKMRELLHWTASEVDIVAQPLGFNEWARGAAVVAIQEYVRRLVPAAE